MTLEFRPLSKSVGAQVIGLDLTKPYDARTTEALRQAFLGGYQRPSLIYPVDPAQLLPILFLDLVSCPIPMPNIAYPQFSLVVV